MKQKIYIVTYVSFTSYDDYLFSEVLTFTDEDEARALFRHNCEQAYGECEWGSAWDESEDERDENFKFDVEEDSGDGLYEVSSYAYGGYKVQVRLIENEIDV